MIILGIDTGTTQSAYVLYDTEQKKIIAGEKVTNWMALHIARNAQYDACVVEMFSSYGNRTGSEVFEAVLMVGRILEACLNRGVDAQKIYRKDVKMHLCGSMSASDKDVIWALSDRFGGKGTKQEKGFFYGFAQDVWQAFAVVVTYLDKESDAHDNT